jgi:hypothetical protein
LLTLGYTGRAGGFDFVPHVFPELDRQKLSWRMSDHLPLWCEFSVAEAAAPVAAPVTTPTPTPAPSASPRGTRPRR